MSPFVRKVKTASGATAVQIVEKRNGRRRILEHVGSAHDAAELAVLLSAARLRVHGVQDDMLPVQQPGREPAGPVVEHTSSELLWRVLTDAYARLGFNRVPWRLPHTRTLTGHRREAVSSKPSGGSGKLLDASRPSVGR